MKSLILFLVFVIGPVLPLHVEEGCEAKSKWTMNYKWNEILISFWAPPETTSKLLSIDVEFVGQIHPVTYDNIEVYQDQIKLIRIREGEQSQESFTIANITGETWNDVVFTLDTHYNFQNLQNNMLLPLNVSIDHKPRILRISGSNVTVNCRTDSRMWKINDEPVALPLQDSKEHWLTFYSYGKYLPVISLEMRQFHLGWDNGTLTTIPTRTEPLPAFVQHRVMISCSQDAEIICSVKIGEDRKVAEEFRVADFPKSITVSKMQGTSFSVLLLKDEPFTPHQSENLHQTQEMISCEKTRAIALGLGIICPTIIIILVAAAFIIYKKGNSIRSYQEKNSAENSGTKNDIERSLPKDTRTFGDNTSEGSGDALIK